MSTVERSAKIPGVPGSLLTVLDGSEEARRFQHLTRRAVANRARRREITDGLGAARQHDARAREEALLNDRKPPASREEKLAGELDSLNLEAQTITRTVGRVYDDFLRAAGGHAAEQAQQLWEDAQALTGQARELLDGVERLLCQAGAVEAEEGWWRSLLSGATPPGFSERAAPSHGVGAALLELRQQLEIAADEAVRARQQWRERLVMSVEEDGPAASTAG